MFREKEVVGWDTNYKRMFGPRDLRPKWGVFTLRKTVKLPSFRTEKIGLKLDGGVEPTTREDKGQTA